MKTDELIHLLATDDRPVQPSAIEQRFAVASVVGIAGAGVLMLALFGLRPDLLATMALPMFWGKLVFAAALAAAGLALLRRMARPGMPLGHAVLWLAVPPLVLWAMALGALWQVPAAERVPLILGSTWRTCPFNIAALSVPAFVAGCLVIARSNGPVLLEACEEVLDQVPRLVKVAVIFTALPVRRP